MYWPKLLWGYLPWDTVTLLTYSCGLLVSTSLREPFKGEMKLLAHRWSGGLLQSTRCLWWEAVSNWNLMQRLSFYTKSICSCWASALGQSPPQTMLKSCSTDLTHRKSMHLRQKTHKRVRASWWTLGSQICCVPQTGCPWEQLNKDTGCSLWTADWNRWLSQHVRAKSSCWTSYGQMKSKFQCNQLQSLWPVHIVPFPC